MRRIITTTGQHIVIGSNAEASALNEGPETTANFLLALDDALAAGGRCRFVANGTHYSLTRFNEVNREPGGQDVAPRWNPKGTAVTWGDEPGDGISTGTTTGLYLMMGPFGSGPTYYQVVRHDGYAFWVTDPIRRH